MVAGRTRCQQQLENNGSPSGESAGSLKERQKEKKRTRIRLCDGARRRRKVCLRSFEGGGDGERKNCQQGEGYWRGDRA